MRSTCAHIQLFFLVNFFKDDISHYSRMPTVSHLGNNEFEPSDDENEAPFQYGRRYYSSPNIQHLHLIFFRST